MHEKTKRFLEMEREKIKTKLENDKELNNDKEFIKARYLHEFDLYTRLKRINETDNGEKYLADEIIKMMKRERVSFDDACVILGYITKRLKFDDEYRSGIDIEDYYIKEYFSEELVTLAKNILNYIQTQEEVYAYIPSTLGFVHEDLKSRLTSTILW